MLRPTLRQMEYLIALEDEKSFLGAAEKCNVTQSTLSSGIKELENTLEQALVNRGQRKNVGLTAFGSEVTQQARKILSDTDKMMARARQMKSPLTGPLRLGVIPTIAPYFLPMEENFKFFLKNKHYGEMFNKKRIRYEPLELMRGSTYNNSYMILDEAQNCTADQIKMFLTRLGQNSKVIINGDADQTDLRRGMSGLSQAIQYVKGVEGVGIVRFTNADIQRNGIIGKILDAWGSYDYNNEDEQPRYGEDDQEPIKWWS